MFNSPRDKINPPITRIVSKASEPQVFATIIFLPTAAINRNSPDAIWLRHRSKRNCLKNLPARALVRIELHNKNNHCVFYFSPPYIRIKAYDIISHDHPSGDFYKGYWNLHNPCG